MKINLSKIFRYILITTLNILCILMLQYYINIESNISKSLSNLKIAIFVNNSVENNEENIILAISSYNKFKSIEYIDSKNTDGFIKINPELDSVIPKETVSFPSFILINSNSINNLNELETIKNDILNLEFVEDVVYDQKAFSMFFDNQELVCKYKEVFKISFYVIIFIFILKFLFFLVKALYKIILFELCGGILLGLCAYALICLITIFNQDNIFILSGQVLYIVVPLSLMVTLLTKESNA